MIFLMSIYASIIVSKNTYELCVYPIEQKEGVMLLFNLRSKSEVRIYLKNAKITLDKKPKKIKFKVFKTTTNPKFDAEFIRAKECEDKDAIFYVHNDLKNAD